MANSNLYSAVIDLLIYLYTRSSTAGEDLSVDQRSAALKIYEQLSLDLSKLVVEKLQVEDDTVLIRLTAFVTALSASHSRRVNSAKSVKFSDISVHDTSECPVDTSAIQPAADKTIGCSNLSDKNSVAVLLQDSGAALWQLICDSCWMSLRRASEVSSVCSLRYLSAVYETFISDRLLVKLLEKCGESPSDCSETPGFRFFCKILLPLISAWSQLTDTRTDAAKLLVRVLWTSYCYLAKDDKAKALSEMVSSLTFKNSIFVKFCGHLISSVSVQDDAVAQWVRKDEFGLFIVSLTKGLCQRVRAGGQAEIGLTCLDNDKQELICACLTSGWS